MTFAIVSGLTDQAQADVKHYIHLLPLQTRKKKKKKNTQLTCALFPLRFYNKEVSSELPH